MSDAALRNARRRREHGAIMAAVDHALAGVLRDNAELLGDVDRLKKECARLEEIAIEHHGQGQESAARDICGDLSALVTDILDGEDPDLSEHRGVLRFRIARDLRAIIKEYS